MQRYLQRDLKISIIRDFYKRRRKKYGILNLPFCYFTVFHLTGCLQLPSRQRQFYGKYVKQNVGDLLRSLSSRPLATSPLGEIHPGIPARKTQLHPRWIYAGYICFKVPDSASAACFCDFAVLVYPSPYVGLLPSPSRLVSYIYEGGMAEMEGRNARAGVMARISALDLEQRFSLEERRQYQSENLAEKKE